MSHDSGSVAVWDRDAPHAEPTVLDAGFEVSSAACSPDGRLLACARRDGSTVLLDLATGRPLLALAEPRPRRLNSIIQLQFSPGGSSLSCLTLDGVNPPLRAAWPSSPVEAVLRRVAPR